MTRWMVRAVFAFLFLALVPLSGTGAASSLQLVGAGLIEHPISGRTISSASDFGFAVTMAGGTFVCSMAGPLTGGFKGLKVMTVEGPVTKGSLRVQGNRATFRGSATVVLVPGMNKEAVQVISNVPYSVTVGFGGAGKAWLEMKVPSFTKTLGGNTGGTVKIGSIRLER